MTGGVDSSWVSAVPGPVLALAGRGADWAAYVDRLPRLIRELAQEWCLSADGPAQHGHASLVLPVRQDDAAATPAMLKLAYPDEESEHEALGLQRWGGRGAVRLFRADPRRRAMLLERLRPVDLDSLPVLDACEVVAELYSRLHLPAPPQLLGFADYLSRWTPALTTLPGNAPLPRRLVTQAASLLSEQSTSASSGGRQAMLHGDLHGQNVLASDRAPWLVIDPKPMRGDPHAEPAPMLWNRWAEAVATGDVRFAVRRRFHTLVDTAGLDEDRARDWVVIRAVYTALWEIQDAAREHRTPDDDWITRCVTVAKAVQD